MITPIVGMPISLYICVCVCVCVCVCMCVFVCVNHMSTRWSQVCL